MVKCVTGHNGGVVTAAVATPALESPMAPKLFDRKLRTSTHYYNEYIMLQGTVEEWLQLLS